MRVAFNFLTPLTLRERSRLKKFINELALREKAAMAEVGFVFCSDDYLLDINRRFLNHDYFTDIITFNLAASRELIIGEIYISVDRVKENALLHNETPDRELHRVIFHGVLHLCGFKDKSAFDKQLMTAKENEYLDSYFSHVPRGT